jgi:hypothetical protein
LVKKVLVTAEGTPRLWIDKDPRFGYTCYTDGRMFMERHDPTMDLDIAADWVENHQDEGVEFFIVSDDESGVARA